MRSVRRLFAMAVGTLPARTIHRLANLLYVFGRLAARHPEATHQRISHLRGEAVANRRGTTDMSIEDDIDLGLGQSGGFEDVYQGQESYGTGGLIDDLDDFGAGWTGTAKESCSAFAIDTSH